MAYFLQKKDLPFNSISSTAWTHTIMSKIRNEAEAASRQLAVEYGEPLWCKGTGMRNTHVLAIAPTVSNSRIAGCSAGIEPQPANVYTFNGAKGTFIVRNPELEKLLIKKGKNNNKVWDQILADDGSVMNIPSDILSEEDKDVFLTFAEINQLELVRQAAIRQKYIDQSQSLNLMIDPSVSAKDINKLYLYAHEEGIKTLYYQFSKSSAQDFARNILECVSCEA